MVKSKIDLLRFKGRGVMLDFKEDGAGKLIGEDPRGMSNVDTVVMKVGPRAKLLKKNVRKIFRVIELRLEEYCDVRRERGGKDQTLYLSETYPCRKNIPWTSRITPL